MLNDTALFNAFKSWKDAVPDRTPEKYMFLLNSDFSLKAKSKKITVGSVNFQAVDEHKYCTFQLKLFSARPKIFSHEKHCSEKSNHF